MNMMFHRARTERDALNIAKEVLAAILVLLLLSAFLPAHAEEDTETDDFFGLDVILEDPEYFLFDEPEDEIPVITSVGRSNVKVAGVKSKHQLVQYTIPETLLRADENFLALMMEAEKYIGYPWRQQTFFWLRLFRLRVLGVPRIRRVRYRPRRRERALFAVFCH